MKKTAFAIATVLAFALVPTAAAHVEAKPAKVRADSQARITFEVPAEEDVPSVKLAVQIPADVAEFSGEKKVGWRVTVSGRVVTWSGGQIAPGKSAEFVLDAKMPRTPGKTLLFPAVQTYADGKKVHWIGTSESSETPAPRVLLTAPAAQPPAPPPPPAVTTTAPAQEEDDDDSTLWLVIGIASAIVVIALAVMWRRRR